MTTAGGPPGGPGGRGAVRALVVVGTRPEAIKLAPVVRALEARGAEVRLCLTSQHGDLLRPVLDLFALAPSYDLQVMREAQSLTHVTAAVLQGMERVLADFAPDWVVVQGDTTTAMAAALAGFYARARVAHVEAGLRTHDKWSPMPEEMNRRLVAALADVHFAPTPRARDHLLAEGVAPERVVVTGNTVVDALLWVAEQPAPPPAVRVAPGRRLLLVTAHRRENWGAPLAEICGALRAIAERHAGTLDVVFPVHPNPQVRGVVAPALGDLPNVHLLPPVDYRVLVDLMRHAALVLTDSGGLQEEAPTFGVPVLVMRESTERPEAVEAGCARLVGARRERIEAEVERLLGGRSSTAGAAPAVNPFGDGHAAARVAAWLVPAAPASAAPASAAPAGATDGEATAAAGARAG